VRKRERERDRETEAERERERVTETEADRARDRHRERARERDRERDKERQRQRQRQPDRERERERERGRDRDVSLSNNARAAASPSAASRGLNDHSQVDALCFRYEFANFGAGVGTGSWTGPPRGKRTPRVEISSTIFGVRGVTARPQSERDPSRGARSAAARCRNSFDRVISHAL